MIAYFHLKFRLCLFKVRERYYYLPLCLELNALSRIDSTKLHSISFSLIFSCHFGYITFLSDEK